MEILIPATIQPVLNAYLKALEPLQAHFYGIYVYGSIALGAFEVAKSDIDMVALTQGNLGSSELAQLESIHNKLNQQYDFGKKLQIIYLPLSALGKYNDEIAPYPRFQDGKFKAEGQGDLNAVTWWLIKHKGIKLFGAEVSALSFEVTWEDVLKTMDYNLNGYWAVRAEKNSWLFLSDYWIEFGVSTLCRILSAIEDSEIISKSAALERWKDRLPSRFQPLVDEAWRIRYSLPKPSLYRSRLDRMREMLAFVEYVRERGLLFK